MNKYAADYLLRRLFACLFLMLLACGASPSLAVTITQYPLPSTANTGSAPGSGIVAEGNIFYVTARNGGSNSDGALYSVASDGSDYTLLHSFTTSTDGGFPFLATLSGSVLYGSAPTGGAGFNGTLFSIDSDGSNFTVIGTESPTNALPNGPLLAIGNALYGINAAGGPSHQGTLFKVSFDGSGFTVIHSLNTVTEGQNPIGATATDGTTIYGGLQISGSSNGLTAVGTIYSVKTDGTGFQVLHVFEGEDPNDGNFPFAGVTLSGNDLFGTTKYGGAYNEGALWKLNTDGTGFTLLHSFGDDAINDENPVSGVTIAGDTIYGMSGGALYSIDTDGADFQILAGPMLPGGVTLTAETLTQVGSSMYFPDGANIYSFPVPEPSGILLLLLGVLALAVAFDRRNMNLLGQQQI